MGYNSGGELPSGDGFGLEDDSQSRFPEADKWD